MRLLPPDRDEGWTPYVWLVYLNLYVAFPFVFGATAVQWALHVSGLAVFLPLYFVGFWVEGARRLFVCGALTALGLALTWLNPGAAVFFVYASSFVGGARTGARAATWVVGIALIGLAASATAGWWAPFAAVFVAVFAPLIGFVNLHSADTRRRDASLRMAHAEIARLAALAERDRIASDLHDLLGHSLSVIALKADLAAKLIGRDPGRAIDEVTEVARVARGALSEVRQTVHGFRTATLREELERALSVLSTAGVDAHADADAPAHIAADRLSRASEHALALVLREAVTNVIRHARARRCSIELARVDDRIRLVVADDGVGGELVEGSGLAGMRRRVEEAGGTIERCGTAGTRLTVIVPAAPAAEQVQA